MPKYKKRADGRYRTSVVVGYDDETGKQKRKYVYARTQLELDKKITDIKQKLNTNTYADDENITVKDWAERWLDLYKSSVQHNTKTSYKRAVENYIIPYLGDIRLSRLKKINVQEMINAIVEKGNLRTAKLVSLTIKQLLNQAADNELIYKNVANNINVPKYEAPEKRSLTPAELKLFEDAELTDKERAFIAVIRYCGLRRGEALALSRTDFDFVNNILHVSKAVAYTDGKPQIKEPKTKAGIRDIPMPDKLRKIILAYIKNLDGIYLFPSSTSYIMTKSSFRRFWEDILDKVNTCAGGFGYKARSENQKKLILINQNNDITPHIFRHTYASDLYAAGVDLKTAQTYLGHSSISMTMNIYTHLNEKTRQENKQKICNYFEEII